jgi:hypothetical protein
MENSVLIFDCREQAFASRNLMPQRRRNLWLEFRAASSALRVVTE